MTVAVSCFATGCGWKYLYPGRSFDFEDEWEADPNSGMLADDGMPIFLDSAPQSTSESWDTLFPQSDPAQWQSTTESDSIFDR